jgi:hypothetical protein
LRRDRPRRPRRNNHTQEIVIASEAKQSRLRVTHWIASSCEEILAMTKILL